MQTIQDEITNGAAKVKCIEDKGKKYKLGCYIHNELLSTKTGTVEQLKEWAIGPKCSRYTCHCDEQFAGAMYWTWCVWPNTWRCPSHRDETGAYQDIFVKVKNNKKKYCEKMAKKSKCNPNHQI